MRTPIYAKNNPTVRISSFPDDMWRLQKQVAAKGTKTSDNWQNCSCALCKEEAVALLNGYAKNHKED